MNGAPLSEQERLDRLRLSRTENVGPITFRRLLERYGTAERALAALPELGRRGGRAKPLKPPARAAVQAELERVRALGARLLVWGDADYPAALVPLDDAPPILSALGDVSLAHRRIVAIVGARNASLNAKRFAESLARDLGAAGFVVASGLARGIDGAAHQGSLATGTIAVTAGGIDVVYPPEHQSLRDQIAEVGLLLAEHPPGVQPLARHFPQRNRIVAGLSEGVVVVEAALKSGSLITARLALEMGRDVMAVPGSPLDPRCRGANDLIRQGATLVEGADDVIAALARPESRMTERNAGLFAAPPPPEPSAAELDRARAELLEMLSPSPTAIDELLRGCQFSVAVVQTILLELELAGRLERLTGGRVSLLG